MRIGAYETEAELGRGGAGVVFRARAADGRAVALKVLARSDADAAKRFEREIRLQSSLGLESGFVPVLETGVHGGAAFLVMPLVEGGTLRDRLAKGPLGVAETAALGRALARALGAAHARGIVHRDVKPENVLFDRSGPEPRPLLADLGLAKHFAAAAPGASRSASVSQTGLFRGTVGYMAPEQMRDAKTAGPAADVFALGVVLYECLAGRQPFAGETMLDVVSRVEEGSFARIRRFRTDVPAPFARAIERALAADPGARFADAVAFERALAATGSSSRRRVAAALGAAVGLAAFALGARALGPRAASPPPAAGSRAVLLAKEAYLEALHGHDEHALVLAREAVAADSSLSLARAALSIAEEDLDQHLSARADAEAALALDPRCPLALAARAWPDGDETERISLARRALAIDPSLAIAHVALGVARSRPKDAALAIEEHRRAIALDRHAAFAWRLLVRAQMKVDARAALAAADEAIAVLPDFMPLHAERACALFLLHDRDHAIKEVESVLARTPDDTEALELRGRDRYYFQGDFAGAAADGTRIIGREPLHMAAGWFIRGVARIDLGDHERARSDLRRALEIEPSYGEALAMLTRADAYLGEAREAREALARLVALSPKNHAVEPARQWLAKHPPSSDPPEETQSLDALLARGDVNDVKGAIDRTTRAIRLAPTLARAWVARAMAEDIAGDAEAALRDADQAVDLDPFGPDPRIARGILLYERHDFERARKAATRAIELAPARAGSWSLLAEIERLDRRFGPALSDAAQAVLREPAGSGPWHAVAWALADSGQEGPAKEAFARYLETGPDKQHEDEARAWLAQHPR